ncbi:beta-ketoacyl-ACP synthase III [Pollutibacter soli]|uniref:beta-ketoacyl-ACP synthase III n=1 Tax=Pollutibacter soli TaxID=3034157 RepID=UPI003013F59D
MSMNEVYITRTSHYFPNDPVPNEDMESYLGMINGKPSKSRRIVLRNNGIKNRYYALDKSSKATHTNAEMTSSAIRILFKDNPGEIKNVELISCGTSSPDQMMPSHGVSVHGCLTESESVEVVSPAGVCCAGMHALKYAYLAVKSGDFENAVAAGSERFSRLLVADLFESEVQKLTQLEQNPYISFEKEFLRWMLSDGAAAFYLTNKKNETGLSLRIEWIEGVSFANIREACMYMGCIKMPDGSLRNFMDMTPDEIKDLSVLSIKQDVKLLSENIVLLGGVAMTKIFKKRGITANDVDYYLCHISSEFFRSKVQDELKKIGLDMPEEKWFVNLSSVGNVGAASIYLMMDELYHSGKLKKGDRIFFSVPESSRFSYMYAYLTVV